MLRPREDTFKKLCPGVQVCIETGVWKGDLTKELVKHFRQVYAIELNVFYYDLVRNLVDQVDIYHGDSAVLLPDVLSKIREPACIILDAHYCITRPVQIEPSNFPLFKELEAIAQHLYADVVIIDDTHNFGMEQHPMEDAWLDVTEETILNILGPRVVSTKYVDDIFIIYLGE